MVVSTLAFSDAQPSPPADGQTQYAAMSSDQLIDAVLNADARRQLAFVGLSNLRVRLVSEEQRQEAGDGWTPWGPKIDLRFWISERRAERFRVDFMPRILPWYGGPQPFSESRESLFWDGNRFEKVGIHYRSTTDTYHASVSESVATLDAEREERGRGSVDAVLTTLLDDRSVVAALRWMRSPEMRNGSVDAVFRDGNIQVLQHDGGMDTAPRLMTFSAAHDLRLLRVENASFDPQEAPEATYEVLDWFTPPGMETHLPARWVTVSGYPQDSPAPLPARRMETLAAFEGFTPDAPGAPFRVDPEMLGAELTAEGLPARVKKKDVSASPFPNAILTEAAAPEPSPDPTRLIGDIDWRARLLAAESHGAIAFGIGPMMLETEPADPVAELALELFDQLAKDELKTAILKAFHFKRHPRVLDLLDAGMNDPSQDVRDYAAGYLESYALRSFAGDPEGYRVWRADTRGEPFDAIFAASAGRLAKNLQTLRGAEREAFARSILHLDLGIGRGKSDHPGKAEVLREAGVEAAARAWHDEQTSEDVVRAAHKLLEQFRAATD